MTTVGREHLESVWDTIIGQPAVVAQLQATVTNPVHAYLFVGPAGTGKRAAARAFAAGLLCPNGGCGKCEQCTRVLSSAHPDVIVAEREGASISIGQIRDFVTEAARSPSEGARKVLVLADLHLVEQRAPALLKTIEEPPPPTIFVLLADSFPPELVTIASRCVRVEFGPVPPDVLVAALVADGLDETLAQEAAAAADGSVDRARLLANDPHLVERRRTWTRLPGVFDGRGATVAVAVDEVRAAVDSILEPLVARQAQERADLEERAARYGWKGVTKTDEERWTREQRRIRADEVRFGLRTLIAAYRERLGSPGGASGALVAIDAIQAAGEAMIRNPNEVLLLQALFARLSTIAAQARP